MPVLRPDDAVRHAVHGAVFHSVVAPSRGSVELCAWLLEVSSGTPGTAHRLSREEVVLVLDGALRVVLVPAGAEMRVDGGASDARAWVTTTPGLEATMADGARFAPPWAC